MFFDFFLFFFLSLLGGFSVVRALRSCCFWLLKLRFINPGILYYLALDIDFDCYNLTNSKTVLVDLTSIKTGPKSDFGFGVNSLFNHPFEIVEFLTALVYLDSH